MRKILSLLFLLVPLPALAQQSCHTFPSSTIDLQVPFTHFTTPDRLALTSRLNLTLPSTVTDLYMVQSLDNVALFWQTNNRVCGPMIIPLSVFGPALRSIVWRANA